MWSSFSALAGLAAFLSTSPVLVFAAEKGVFGSACVQAHNRLAFGTYQLTTECNAAFYCADNGTCANKGCRRDAFPFGYPVGTPLPPTCDSGSFCPDEGDKCLPLLNVGDPCQLNRDDECSPPSDTSLAGPRNVNGSVCLNFQCMYANVTSGNACVIDNTAYVVYDQKGKHEFNSIISRDNCANGFYCEGTQHKCAALKNEKDSCASDKECASNNCGTGGTCGIPTDTTVHVASWVYAIIVVAIVLGMVGTLWFLFILHRRARTEVLEKRSQYWREQEAFRNNILAMREQARASMLSGQSVGGHRQTASETSQLYASIKPSGLSQSTPYAMDSRDSMEESLVPHDDAGAYGGTALEDSRVRSRNPANSRF